MTEHPSTGRETSGVSRARVVLTTPPAGLLLDLDGTLVDSEPVHRAAFRAYFDDRGWTVGDEVIRQFAGRRGIEAFAAIDGPWAGEDPALLTTAVIDRLPAMLGAARPVPGAADLLTTAARTGLGLCVVTSAMVSWTTAALAMLELPDDVRAAIRTVTAEDCPAGKPDPYPYRRGAEVLGLPVERCVALEDAPAGIASARNAGVAVVLGVMTSHSADVLVAAGADDAVAELTGLLDPS